MASPPEGEEMSGWRRANPHPDGSVLAALWRLRQEWEVLCYSVEEFYVRPFIEWVRRWR